jgi:hypothetical protein
MKCARSGLKSLPILGSVLNVCCSNFDYGEKFLIHARTLSQRLLQ